MASPPRIIYGTAWKKGATAELVTLAIDIGFRAIDTACQPKHYDEAGVGAGITACLRNGLTRQDLYLQTKFTALSGQDRQRIPYNPKAPLAGQIAESIVTSLKNLQTDYLDCLVLHSPMPTPPQTLDAWRTFESFVDTGKVRRLGISNCYAMSDLERLYDGVRIKPTVVQNRFYADTGYDTGIRAFCRQHEITYQSFWTLSANPHLLSHKVITTLAGQYKRTPEAILFRYLTQNGVVPLTGTKSAVHMREDLSIFEFDLTEDELSKVGILLVGTPSDR